MGAWSRELAELPAALSAHVMISALASLVAVLIGVPLALLLARRPRARGAVLGAAAVVQTVPALALLALMVPLLGAFGFWPALFALTLYGLLPILRNTVTGILGVDAAALEAADAMGMTARERLWRVELPLALPVMLAGVRTSVVWTVGMATLSTPVGQPSLGSFIFGGLQTKNWHSVIVGCAAAALLAVALDTSLAVLDAALARRRRSLALGAGVGLLALVAAGALAPAFGRAKATRADAGEGTPGASPADAARSGLGVVRVGAKTFTEQYVLASLLERRLAGAGLAVERRESLGSTVVFDALANDDIDVYVEYTGTIWSSLMKRQAPEPAWKTLALASAWLAERYGVRLLGALGFENAYCLALRGPRARALGVRSLEDLARVSSGLVLGSDYEFPKRGEWERLREVYGLGFAGIRSYDPSFMYSAVAAGEVDLITAFSSDGRIDALDLVVLEDPRRAFPPYDAVLLLSPRAAQDEAVVGALLPLLGAVSVEVMREANHRVDRDDDKRTPEQAAAWLSGRLPAPARAR